jgi:hypothetical protein
MSLSRAISTGFEPCLSARRTGEVTLVTDSTHRLQLSAIGDRAFRYSAAFAERNRAQAATVGSGTLFTFEGRAFVVTVAHVIKDILKKARLLGNDYECVLGARDSSTPPIRLTGLAAFFLDEPHDIAVVELATEQVAHIGLEHFADQTDIAPIGFTARSCLIGGFPTARDNLAAGQLNSRYMRILADLLDGPPTLDGLLYPPQPSDVWCLHQTNGRDLEGDAKRMPALVGISGAAIWGISHVEAATPIWTPTAQIKLIGIEKSYHNDRFIRGTDWLTLAGLLCGIDSHLRSRLTVRDTFGEVHPRFAVLEPVRVSMP